MTEMTETLAGSALDKQDESAIAQQKIKEKLKKKTSTVKIANLVHSFVGLKLSIIFSIVLVSGALAVFAAEFDWLIYSEMRVTPVGEKMDEGELFDRLKAEYPSAGSLMTANDRTHTAASSMYTAPDGALKQAFIDPYTGEIKGDTNLLTVGNFLSFLHVSLFLPLFGRAFVNFFGILCFVGLVAGLISYPKFWKGFFKYPRRRRKQNLRVTLSNLHKFLGVWSIWFILIMGVTGTWWFYQYPLVFFDVAPQVLPERTIEPALTAEDLNNIGQGSIPVPLTNKEIVASVKAHDPDFVIHMLTPPEHNGMAYSVSGTKHELLTQKWASTYYLHPYTGEVLGDRLVANQSGIQRFDSAMEPLHYGNWGYDGAGDLAVKTVWFVFGLFMAYMAISGMIIYYQRTKAATRKLLPSEGMKRKTKRVWLVVRPWGGSMSLFKYANIAFLAMIIAGTSVVINLTQEGARGSGFQYKAQQVGDWTISLNAIRGLLEKDLDPIAPGIQTTVFANFEAGDPTAVKFIYVSPKKPRTTRAPGFVIHGSPGFQHAHLQLPKSLKENGEIWVTIEDWQGNFHQASWPLMPDGVNTIDLREGGVEVANNEATTTPHEKAEI